MSNWKLKSEKNISSAELLIANSYFASSVHCSYYGNIQLMLHVLNTYLGKTEKQIDKESYEAKDSSHNWLKGQIVRNLRKKDVREFNNTLGNVKKLRVIADYKNIKIINENASEALGYSKKINEILKKNFEL